MALVPKTVINNGILTNPACKVEVKTDFKTSYVEHIFQNLRKRLEQNGDEELVINADLGKKKILEIGHYSM